MNEKEIQVAKELRELEVFFLKSANNVDEKTQLVSALDTLKHQLTLIVGRRIIKETYKNG